MNAKKWDAVRGELTPRYYRSFVGPPSHPGSLRYVLPHPASQASLTPADVSAAQVSLRGNRAMRSFGFGGGNVVFVYIGGRWPLDGAPT